MIRKIKLHHNIVRIEEMKKVLAVFPILRSEFTRRNSLDEYYFTAEGRGVIINFDQLKKLTDLGFTLTLNFEFIEINW